MFIILKTFIVQFQQEYILSCDAFKPIACDQIYLMHYNCSIYHNG